MGRPGHHRARGLGEDARGVGRVRHRQEVRIGLGGNHEIAVLEAGAEALVAAGEGVDGGPQPVRVDPLGQRQVEPLRGEPVAGEQSGGGRRQRHAPRPGPLPGRVVNPRRGREGGERLVAEDVAHLEPEAGPAGAGGELEAEDRVPAPLEEIVVTPDGLDLQHCAPERGERRLGSRQRRLHRPGSGLGDLHGGQRAAVDLAVRQQREGADDADRGGHHVFGQDRGEMGAKVRQGGRAGGALALRHRVGDEPGAAVGGLLGGDERGGDGGMGGHRPLDLGRLDAEAADLDLGVAPAVELEAALGRAAAVVAGEVDPPEAGLLDEHGRGPVRVAEVAGGDAGPPMAISPITPGAPRAEEVEDVDGDVRQGGGRCPARRRRRSPWRRCR